MARPTLPGARRPSERPPWIPGRVLGATSLVLAPLLWTAGLFVQWLAKHRASLTSAEMDELGTETFAAPTLLVVHERQPDLSTAGWTLLMLGIILLVPAFLSVGHLAAVRAPTLAAVGATLVTVGLLARMFYLGIDAVAFDLVTRLGATEATPLFLDGYGDLAYAFWRVPVVASAGTIVGSLALAAAAFASGTWGTARCLLILPAGWLEMGVLKEHDPGISGIALTLALLPTGVALLRDRAPSRRAWPHRDTTERHRLRGYLSW